VKLIDFGVAKSLSGTIARSCVGTTEIMAPELVSAKCPGTRKSPILSGATCYHCYLPFFALIFFRSLVALYQSSWRKTRGNTHAPCGQMIFFSSWE